ncbi:MAG TPA: ABC transporter ATP-binding protein [Candidatus Gracilibacteria bacterium]|nr:ABC transporter ATP-binding protein [Candidatus Gracilibacteria bacterium]
MENTKNAIEVSGLVKVYDNGTRALNGVDLTIKSGDFFGLLGANGAGKTTIIGILSGLVNKTEGGAKILGIDIDRDHNAAKKQMGLVPQEFNFNIFEKVIDIVTQQAGFFGIPLSQALKNAEPILKKLDLWNKKDQASRTLSGGMKRRLMIARALVHHPKLLILDEPTAGVDVELRHSMWDYLRHLNAHGTTILLTTHYLEEAEQMCKNVAIIKEGEIVKSGNVKSLIGAIDKQTYVVTVSKLVNGGTNGTISGYDFTVVDENTVEVDLGVHQSVNDLVHLLNEQGIQVQDLRPKGNRLEQLFLNILKG